MNKVKEIGESTEERIGIGSLWKSEEYGYAILAQVGIAQIGMIGVKDGNRFKDGIIVDKVDNITEEEFNKITKGYHPIKRVHVIEIRTEDKGE